MKTTEADVLNLESRKKLVNLVRNNRVLKPNDCGNVDPILFVIKIAFLTFNCLVS